MFCNLEIFFGLENCNLNLNSPNSKDDDFEEVDDFEKDVLPVNPNSPSINEDICAEECFESPRQRCPSFTKQLIQKIESESVIQHHVITNDMIVKGANYATCIACVNLSYSTYAPSLSSSPLEHHCCSICRESLWSVSQFFYQNNMDDLCHLSSGAVIHAGNPKFMATVKAQSEMNQGLINILLFLRECMHFRPTELIHALYYFEGILKRHWMCSTFCLLRQSLKTVFIACCLIAHKINSDETVKNSHFSNVFKVSLATLNEFERTVLTLLEYRTRLDERRYSELEAIVGVGEDYYAHLCDGRSRCQNQNQNQVQDSSKERNIDNNNSESCLEVRKSGLENKKRNSGMSDIKNNKNNSRTNRNGGIAAGEG